MASKIIPFSELSAAQREQAAEILVSAFAHEPSAWKTMHEARSEVASFYEDAERRAWAAIDGDMLAGWIGGVEQSSHAWELHPLAVAPAFQKRGIGRQLVARLEAEAKQAGMNTIWLGSDDGFGGTSIFGADLYPDVLEKLKALAPVDGHPFTYYMQLGYVVIGVIPDANGPGRHDIMMAKRI